MDNLLDDQIPYDILLNICKYLRIQDLRNFCKLTNLENDLIKKTIKWHIKQMGLPIRVFYEDCLFYLKKDNMDLKFPIQLDQLYLFFITKLSESWIWNKKLIKKLLLHSVEDNIFLFSTFWINFVSDVTIDVDDQTIEIYRIVLKEKFYINRNIVINLFDNTYFPMQILFNANKTIDTSIFPSENFLVLQRMNGNCYQIHNYNLIKEIYRCYDKYMYLKLIREERNYVKRIVRIGNPYSKGKTIKLGSSLFTTITTRLKRDGFIGTFLDLQLERKLLIDEYQKLFF